jgi:hypothetical protein
MMCYNKNNDTKENRLPHFVLIMDNRLLSILAWKKDWELHCGTPHLAMCSLCSALNGMCGTCVCSETCGMRYIL